MNMMKKLSFFLALMCMNMTSAFASATCPKSNPTCSVSVPEMDASVAVLGLGLLVGVLSLVSEYRRKK